MKIELEYDEVTSQYIDRFERLFYKIHGFIIIYEKDYYGNTFNKSQQIELDKNDPAMSYNICKVFENYVYFYNQVQGDSLVVMNFDNKAENRSFKINCISEFKFQNTDHPFVLSDYGIYNVFYPAPLISRWCPNSSSTICGGILIDDTEDMFRNERKLSGNEYSYDSIYSHSFLDYIPEFKIGVMYKHVTEPISKDSTETQSRYQVTLLSFARKELVVFQLKDPKLILNCSPSFLTRVITKVTFYTGRE